MANKTIPQLPEQTGLTDNDLLAIVDSGETTTSKIKVSTLLSGAGGKYIAADGTNNIVPDYYATSSIDSSSNESAIIAGTGNTIASSTQYSGVFAGQNNTSQGIQTAVVAGQGHLANGTRSVIVGGLDNDTNGTNVFIGGGRNNLATSTQASLIGGQSNTTATQNSAILGGRNNLISGNDGGILASNFSNVTGKGGCVIASEYATVNTSSTIIAGWGTYVYGDTSAASQPQYGSYAIYAPYSYVRRDNGTGTSPVFGKQNGLLSSDTCEINGQSGNKTDRGVIIGSNNTNLTGGTTNTLMLGCSGRTGTNSYTTYFETLEAFTHVVLNDYSNLNFASDSAAATGGVPLGGLYHNSGDLKVRIT